MGVRTNSISTSSILGSPIVTTAETIIATTGPLGLTIDNAEVLIWWMANITLTGSTTAFTARLRRGNALASTLVNVAQAVTAAANTTILINGCYRDTPGVVAGVQYSLSVQMTAAAANSTVNDVSLIAMSL